MSLFQGVLPDVFIRQINLSPTTNSDGNAMDVEIEAVVNDVHNTKTQASWQRLLDLVSNTDIYIVQSTSRNRTEMLKNKLFDVKSRIFNLNQSARNISEGLVT